MSPKFLTLCLLALPGVLACNLGGKPVTDDDTAGTDDTGPAGDDVTIADIRTGAVPLDAQYTVEHVIVTSPHTQGDEGFFVQDAGGGANSGIYVWSYDGVGDIFAEPGDEVRITGTPTDFYGWIEFSVESVEITGTGTIPDPVDLGDGTAVTDWEPYESVLVTITGQSVESVNEYGTGLLAPSGISLDNGFVNFDLTCGGTYPTVTGVMFYTYEVYSLNPRSEDDLSGAELPDTVSATCADVQAGVCGTVQLTDVVVTSEAWTDDDGAYFFVQDQGGGEYSGLLVFLEDLTFDVAVGDTVTVTGSVNEFYGLTELKVTDAANIETTGTGVPVATVLSEVPSDWEPWESCLVTLTNVDVTSAEEYGEVQTSWGVAVDDLFYDFDAAEGDHWDNVTGPVYYSYETWKVEPRSASDLD